jgi:hypothetical protein
MDTNRTFNKLFARLQLQAKLREISDHYGEDTMLAVVAEALQVEFKHLDWRAQNEKNHSDHNTSS